MDAVTAMTIDRGRKNNQLLIQAQYSPMPVAEQVAILYCGTRGLLKNVPLNKVRDFQEMFLQVVRSKLCGYGSGRIGSRKLVRQGMRTN